jgi:hypothetical protein
MAALRWSRGAFLSAAPRKYVRREKPYIVTEAISIDEDGRLIDRVITHELKRPQEVGKKWGQ